MKSVTKAALPVIALIGSLAACAGETLYNGIVLPDKWPPAIDPKNE